MAGRTAAAFDLKEAHSTGGGKVARYPGRHGTSRVAKAVPISAVPPIMPKSDKNPGGPPIDVFDGFRATTTRSCRSRMRPCSRSSF
jgi:non-heme chloroperoxidase